jgi:hypothetical protein
MVIQPQFAAVSVFAEGLALIRVAREWGYVDKSDRVVIPPQFDSAEVFVGGLAWVMVTGQSGSIDQNRTVVIEPQFERAESFAGGLAAVHKIDQRIGANGLIEGLRQDFLHTTISICAHSTPKKV